MDDSNIIELFLKRSQDALAETDKKFRSYCYAIAFSILGDTGETEECINDTYLKLWNSIPPVIPEKFSVFIARIVRNTAFHLYSKKKTLKRGKNEINYVLSELEECVDMHINVEEQIENKELENALLDFLNTLEPGKRDVFMLRYWYAMPVKQIAEKKSMKEGTVKSVLSRTRKELKQYLKSQNLY